MEHVQCSLPSYMYDSYENATKVCEADKQCEGIIYDDCNNENKISLCMEGSKYLPNQDIESCVYMKQGGTNVPDHPTTAIHESGHI